MKATGYFSLWAFVLALLIYEYAAINFKLDASVLYNLKNLGLLSSDIPLTTEAGRPISLALGWTGLVLIFMTNLYIIRKKVPFLSKLGSILGWLDFHIFLGLVGPTCIVFHADFKVQGLVGIAFWSMIIIALSGVLGRYLFLNSSAKKEELNREMRMTLEKLQAQATNEDLQKNIAKHLSQLQAIENHEALTPFAALWKSIKIDVRAWRKNSAERMSHETLYYRRFVRLVGKIRLVEPMERALGYWHVFHIPFSIVMYLAIVVHVISSLIFMVDR